MVRVSDGLRGALRNLSLKALSLGFERVCRLVVVVASAPVLGQTAFGRFVYAWTLTALLAMGTDLGLSIWTTRSLARSRDEVEGKALVRAALGLRGLASLPYGLAVTAVAAFAVQGEARAAVLLLGVAALLNAFADHVAAILRGYERFRQEAGLSVWRAVVVSLAGFTSLTQGRSLASLCAAIAAASLLGCAYGFAVLRPLHAMPSRGAGRLPPTPLIRVAKVVLGDSLPIWFAGLLSMLYFKVDHLFLRWMTGDAELGAYGAAFKLFEGAMFVPAVVLSVTFPRLARARHDRRAQEQLERHISVLLFGLGLLAGALYLLAARELVRAIYGAGFDRVVVSLRVLAIGIPLLYVNYSLTHFLIARDMGRTALVFALSMLALNILLDIVLIPRALGPGAAWATVLTEAALTGCCFWALKTGAKAARDRPSSSIVPPLSRTDRTAA